MMNSAIFAAAPALRPLRAVVSFDEDAKPAMRSRGKAGETPFRCSNRLIFTQIAEQKGILCKRQAILAPK